MATADQFLDGSLNFTQHDIVDLIAQIETHHPSTDTTKLICLTIQYLQQIIPYNLAAATFCQIYGEEVDVTHIICSFYDNLAKLLIPHWSTPEEIILYLGVLDQVDTYYYGFHGSSDNLADIIRKLSDKMQVRFIQSLKLPEQ